MLLLVLMLLAPIIALLVAVAMVVFARMTGKSKANLSTLVRLSLLFALVGIVASLIFTIAWMSWYEKTSGYSAGNAPVGWLLFYGPFSSALGQLLALIVWWLKKPTEEKADVRG